MTATRAYRLHGHDVVITGWPSIVAAVDARLERFRHPGEPDTPVVISYELAPPKPAPANGERDEWRCIYEDTYARVTFAPALDVLRVEVSGHLRAECSPGSGHARVWASRPFDDDRILGHPVLTILLLEILKRRGLYSLHAAGIVTNGQAILIAGPSGAGKSTLSVALARAGCQLLGDDTLFLTAGETSWRCLAFPDQIDLCGDAFRFFPELAAGAGPLARGDHKFHFRPGSVYGATVIPEGRPAVLVFPSSVRSSVSTLSPLDEGDALMLLAPNVLLTQPEASQRHFDALAGLVAQCRAYRLQTGGDLKDAADQVRGLVA